MLGWFSLTTAALLLVACTIQEANAQATIQCFTRTGCNDEDSIGNLTSVRDCCGLPDSISYVPAIGAESCSPCRTYGWAQNISSDLSRSEFQTSPISAVEGETVSLTLFLFKNIPRSTIIFRLDFLRGGTAEEETDYTISYTDELNRPDINLIELRGIPIQVNVTLLNDGIGGEGEESIILTLQRNVDLTPDEDFNLLTNNEVTINVGDNDVRTGFESGEKITVSEGNMTVLLCLSTSGVPSTVTTLTVSITYGTAEPADVNLITPEVLITQTNQEPCVRLQVIDDNVGLEGVENLTITLNGPANVEFTNRTIEVCIQDINVVEFGFLAGDADTAEAEGNEADENINVVITRSGETAMDVELIITPVVYNESFGISISPFDPDSPNIATPGQDFPEDVISIIIPAGEGPTTVQIPIINDTVAEDSEQHFIGILNFADDMPPSGVTLGIRYILLSILEDDAARLEFSAPMVSVMEQNVDFTYFVNVTRDIDSELNYPFSISSTSVTAEADDFTVVSGPFRFPPDVSFVMVPVTIRGDTDIELTDEFELEVGLAGSPSFIPPLTPIRVSILNDDGNYMYVPQQDSVVIGEGESSVVTYSLLNPPSDGIFDFEFNVTLSTVEGTATGGSDYVEKVGELIEASTLPNGTFSTTVTVLDDERIELPEQFTVVGMVPAGPDGAMLPVEFTSDLTISISNNDLLMVSLDRQTETVIEGRDATICINEIDADNLDANITLNLAAASGTATEDVDFMADDVMITVGSMGVVGSGMMLQPMTSITSCILVQTVVDNLIEGDETLTVSVEATSNADLVSLGSGSSATVTIVDITVELSVQEAQYNVVEGANNFQVCVVASDGTVIDPVTVSFSAVSVSASDDDYTLETDSVILNAGNPTGCADISITSDNLVEGNETFMIVISSDTEHAILGTATATVTIIGELAMIGFERGMFAVVEPRTIDVCITVRNGLLAESLAVPIDVLPATTATEGMDYEFPVGQVINIAAGTNRSCIRVNIVQSAVVEEEEQIVLGINTTVNADIVGPQTTITIVPDSVVVVGFRESGYTVLEGETVDIVVLKTAVFESAIAFEVFVGGASLGVFEFPAGGSVNDSDIMIPYTAPDNNIALQDNLVLQANLDIITSSPQIVALNTMIPITIIDDEGDVMVGFDDPGIVVREGDGNITVSVSIDQDIENPLSVLVAFRIVSAFPGSDYVDRPVTLEFTGNGTLTFDVEIVNDDQIEPTESFNLTLVIISPNEGVAIGAGTFTVVILDDDLPRVRFDRAPAVYFTSEMDNNVSVCIIVTNGRLPDSLMVDVDVLPSSTAELGEDFDFIIGPQITIPEGEFMGCLSVSIIQSPLVEGEELIVLGINGTTTPAIVEPGLGEVIIVIRGDGDVTVGFDQADYSFLEGQPAVVTIEKSGPLDSDIILEFSDGVSTTTYTFPAGDATPNSISVTLNVSDNNIALEPPRLIQLSLSIVSPVGGQAVLGQGTATVTITDDEGAVSIQFDETDISVLEDVGNIMIPVSISSPVAVTVQASFSYDFMDTDTDDLVITGQSEVVFRPGDPTTQNILIAIIDDLKLEPEESFSVILRNPVPSNGDVVITSNTTTVTIIDNDVGVVIGFQDSTLSASEDSGTVNIPVTLPIIVAPVTVSLAFTGFSAVEGTDYRVIGPTTLTFDTNGTQFVSVEIIDNFIDDSDRGFTVSLVNVTSAGTVLVFPDTLTFTIVDNDNTLTVGFGNVEFSLGESSGITILPIVISEPVATGITFDVVYIDGTATLGTDYSGITTSVSIPPSSTQGEVFVGVNDDFVVEGDETFSIALVNPMTSATVTVDPNVTTITIIDDDQIIRVGFEMTSLTVNEGAGPIQIPVTINQPVPTPVTVSVSFVDGSATEGSDYFRTGQSTLTFNSNGTSNILVGIVNDALFEPTESFSIILTNAMSDATVVIDPDTITIVINDDDPPTVQPPTVDIVNDTVVGDPFYTVPIDIDGAVSGLNTADVSLCYELHGSPGATFSLVNDVCTLVNAHYRQALPGVDVNVIDRIGISTKDSSDIYRNISMTLAGCSVSVDGVDIPSRYESNNVSVIRYANSAQPRVRVSVPSKCDDIALVMWMICENRPLPNTGETPVSMIKFVIARGYGISGEAHGLLGQMWNVRFTVTNYTGQVGFLDPSEQHFYVTVDNTRTALPTRTFVASLQPRSWDRTRGYCLYAGNRQSGPTGDIPEEESPNDSVIEGRFNDYVVSSDLASDCRFCDPSI